MGLSGRPCGSSAALLSIVAPTLPASAMKSAMVQKWMFGVSYQDWERHSTD
jgi:hypothetical protein